MENLHFCPSLCLSALSLVPGRPFLLERANSDCVVWEFLTYITQKGPAV